MLEEHGFVFHRIWSRDWWENSERELQKLNRFIHEQDSNDNGRLLFNSPSSEHIELEKEYFGATSQMKPVSVNVTKERRLKKKQPQLEIEEFKNDDQPTLFEPVKTSHKVPVVGIGSQVKVQLLDDKKVVAI